MHKKTNVNLELLTDVDMLLMIEAGIRGGMCQSVHRYAKVNNKYMKNYNKNIESSYLMNLDANNLHGGAMAKTLPANGFKWENDLSRFNEDLLKNYNEDIDAEYFLQVDMEYPKELWGSYKDLPLLPQRKKLQKVLKQALDNELTLKEVNRVIKFNQEVWLKPYIDKNIKLRKEAKNDFEKVSFKLMNSVFGKTMENVRKHRDIKLITTEEKRIKLGSEPKLSYNKTIFRKFFSDRNGEDKSKNE